MVYTYKVFTCSVWREHIQIHVWMCVSFGLGRRMSNENCILDLPFTCNRKPLFSGLHLDTNKNPRTMYNYSKSHCIFLQKVPISWGYLKILFFSHALTALIEVNSKFIIRNLLKPSLVYCKKSMRTQTFLFLNQAAYKGFLFLDNNICIAFCYQKAETTIVDSSTVMMC